MILKFCEITKSSENVCQNPLSIGDFENSSDGQRALFGDFLAPEMQSAHSSERFNVRSLSRCPKNQSPQWIKDFGDQKVHF